MPTNQIVPNIQDKGRSKAVESFIIASGCPAVGVIRRKLPKTQTEFEKVCCVNYIFLK